MKKIIIGLAILAVSAGAYTVAFAEKEHAEDRISHYESKTFSTSESAVKSLQDDNSKISGILKAEKLTGAQLEKIHEISYGLENAIDTLIEKKAGDATKLEATDEAIQAVHYASENHEEAKVREWFVKLKTAVGDLNVTNKEAKSSSDNVYEVHIKGHTFTPDELHVPAGQKIKLVVHNDDPTPEEFESDDFRREKIIAGNSKATIHVGPLKAGKYHFFGEFNLDKANGYLYAE